MAVTRESLDEKVRVVRRFVDNFNRGDNAEAIKALAEDVRYIGPVYEGIWWANGDLVGRQALLEGIMQGVEDHFEHLEMRVEDVYTCGEQVVVISRHDGVTKSGKTFDSPLVQVFTVDDGAVSELRDFADTAGWQSKLDGGAG